MRKRLLEAALIEFAAHGFIGASTRTIALRAGAHQPQINYHFASKDALWRASIDHLFNQLVAELAGPALPERFEDQSPESIGEHVAGIMNRFIRFAARHPELHQIMLHESTAPSDRLEWMTRSHVHPVFAAFKPTWQYLRNAGIAAPIDADLIHHVLVGAASLIFVNAHEFTLLTGADATEADCVDRHVRGLVSTLLPGLNHESIQNESATD